VTAADQPTPRVGDTITTAEQLDALPDGVVIGDLTSEDEPTWWHSPDGGVWLGTDGSERDSAWIASDGQTFTVLYRPDAPHPAPVDGDAVERAHRAWNEYPDYDADTDERDAWSHERDRIAVAVAAARAGEAVGREALVKAGTELAVEHLGYADMSVRVLVERITDAVLAARGDAAPSDTERVMEQEQTRNIDGDYSLWRRTVTYGLWREVPRA